MKVLIHFKSTDIASNIPGFAYCFTVALVQDKNMMNA